MAALVEILFHNGAIITGSDVEERFYTDEVLEKLGLKALPFSEKNITPEVQYVVYSSAYKVVIAYNKRPDINMIPYGQNASGDFKLTFGQVANEKNNFSVGIFGDEQVYLKVPQRLIILRL